MCSAQPWEKGGQKRKLEASDTDEVYSYMKDVTIQAAMEAHIK